MLQGYTFVPVYRLLYVCFAYLSRFVVKKTKRKGPRFSWATLISEVLSLCAASASLLIPYEIYFQVVDVPQHVNKVWLAMFFFGYVLCRIRQEIVFHQRRKAQPVFVDFKSVDEQGRVLLDSFWTLRDLERYWIDLEPGITLNVFGRGEGGTTNKKLRYAVGSVVYDQSNKRWVLELNNPPADTAQAAA